MISLPVGTLDSEGFDYILSAIKGLTAEIPFVFTKITALLLDIKN
jgi:hypothetical protein